jgi:pyruvate/2-oxoglutarate/acetoin dehydrogenase E1 component
LAGADIPMPYAKNFESFSLPSVASIVRLSKQVLNVK